MADELTVDRIAIKISAEAAAASRTLRSLGSAATKLSAGAGAAATETNKLLTSVTRLRTALGTLDVSKLAELGRVTVSRALGRNLGLLADAANKLSPTSVTNLRSVASAMRPIASLAQTDLSKAATRIKSLAAAMTQLGQVDIHTLTKQLRELNSALAPFASTITKLSAAINSLPPSWRSAGAAARTMVTTNKYLKKSQEELEVSTTALSSAMTGLKTALNFGTLFYGATMVGRGIGALIDNVSSYVEDMNLFSVVMGQYAEEELAYAKQVESVLGIDSAAWARNQGVFMSLISGMGQTTDKAAVMSRQLTQLGYDIASFYNLDVDTAFLKIQSGIAGELEPLRRIGWDLSDARMQIEANRLVIGDLAVDLSDTAVAAQAQAMGIQKSTREMTQAEKVALRYHLIMSQLTFVHGDMARTIASPANQLRILSMQATLAARAVGTLLIPALNAVLPVAIGVVKAIRLVAQAIADFFGIGINFDVDYSAVDTSSMVSGIDLGGVEDVADAFDDVGGSAGSAKDSVEELKRTIMGFDEINKLNAETSSAGGGGGGKGGTGSVGGISGGGLDIPLETYDFLGGLTDKINEETDQIAQKVKNLLPLVTAVGAALIGWKVGGLLSSLGLISSGLSGILGIALTVGGAVYYVWQWLDAWNNGVNWQNILGMLGGIAVAATGLGLAFGTVFAGVMLVVGGVGLLVDSIKDMLENGVTLENALGYIAGAALVVAGMVLIGLTPVKIMIAAIVLGVGALAAGFKDLCENGPTPANVALIVAGLALIAVPLVAMLGVPGLIVAAIITAAVLILMNLKKIGAWWDQYIAKPWEESNGDVWVFVCSLWNEFCGWIDDTVVKPVKEVWNSLFGENGTVATAAHEAWLWIVGVWNAAKGWFKEHVTDPIVKKWNELFGENGSVRTAAHDAWLWIVGIWQAVKGWFKEHVTDPVAKVWDDLFGENGSISTAAHEAWLWIVGIWQAVKGWFEQNVTEPVAKIWEDLFGDQGSISTAAHEAWLWVVTVWTIASTWFDEHVIQPVAYWFNWLFGENGQISKPAKDAWAAVKGAWEGAVGWFDTWIITPLNNIFSWLFGNVSTNGYNAAQSIYNNFGGLPAYFNGIVAQVQSTASYVNSYVNSMRGTIANMGNYISTFGSYSALFGGSANIRTISAHGSAGQMVTNTRINNNATGGLLDTGELFIAREAGPELVGTIGGKTGVANNAQIVEAVSAGVERAVLRAMAASGGGSSGGEIVMRVDGRELARAVYSGQRDLARAGHISLEYA